MLARPRISPAKAAAPLRQQHRARRLHLDRVHLPSQWPTHTPYAAACDLQAVLAAPHHAYKAGSRAGPDPPRPSVLSFTSAPTYTLGRRQKGAGGGEGTAAEEEILTAPLRISRRGSGGRSGGEAGLPCEEEEEEAVFTPVVSTSPRGGLTTYHGPGQLVLWPVLDLRSPLYPALTVRSYARLLENTTVHVLREVFGVGAVLDGENPGVWVEPRAGGEKEGEGAAEEGKAGPGRKIAAMGIHLRRHVATLGVALNITTEVEGPGEVNPWARFVPCGIEGRGVTSVAAELGARAGDARRRGMLEGEYVAGVWADELVRRLEGGV